MRLNQEKQVAFYPKGLSSEKAVVREFFTKRTGWGHNLSHFEYYKNVVTIAIGYNGDIMGKTALRLIATSQNLSVDRAARLSGKRSVETGNAPAKLDVYDIGHEFHYWDGLTGARYLHSVYSLQDCPELPKANYIMVRKLENGEAIPLFIGQTIADAASLNLAHIRQKAARLGANEIHIHVMTETSKERDDVERDLLKGQFQRIENKLRAQAANCS